MNRVGLSALALTAMQFCWAAKPYYDTTSWDPHVANITDSKTYLRRKFRQDVTDRTTGLTASELHGLLGKIVATGGKSGESWRITKARCFEAQAMRMAIDVSPYDWFPAISVWNRWKRPISDYLWIRADEVNRAKISPDVFREWSDNSKSGVWCMWQDFDHSVPDWRDILKIGFPGMKARLEKYAGVTNAAGGYDDPFFEGLRRSMNAVLGGIGRFVEQGEKRLRSEVDGSRGSDRLTREIASLKRLQNGPPETAYDVLMFVWLYFFFSEHLDGIQCRSLTEIDVFLTPYYDRDIALGRTTEAEFREQLKHWLWQWGSIGNYWNQPVGIGGTKANGATEFNHVSRIILDVMDECALTTPKFLAKIAHNTPDWALNKMLDMARRHRSICFISEETAARVLKRQSGVTDEDCRTMSVGGCYEFGLRDARNGCGAGNVNLLKPMEEMLSEAADGRLKSDLQTFGDFKDEYLRRVSRVTTRCREVANEIMLVLGEINPANMMTLSTEYALKTHKDGLANGCPRGNSSGIGASGMGTAVDALMAVKELVYEKHENTLAELGKIMAADWRGHEALRQRILRSRRKWGNNDPEANAIGGEIIKTFSAQLLGFPNTRGGRYSASGHSARQYIELGAKTGATPDGRKAGDEMSKNLSPTMGADVEGATALVMTLANSATTALDLPGDYPLDMMLHPSACEGERGIETMKTLMREFHKNGGSVIQFTVFSAEELRDAQVHPEKYENLQVRVCGWNVRWNDLCKKEQDAYIRRAEAIVR